MTEFDPNTVDWTDFFAPRPAEGDLVFLPKRRGGSLLGALKGFSRVLRPLLRRGVQVGVTAAKKGAKAAVRTGARMAKEEAIKAGKAMLNDFSQDNHAPVTHVIRDRAREAALKMAQRVRQGKGLGSNRIKGKRSSKLGIVKTSPPKRGRRRLLQSSI